MNAATLTALATAASLAAEQADENGGSHDQHEAAAAAHDAAGDAQRAAGNEAAATLHYQAADAHRRADGSDGEAEAEAYAKRTAAQEASDQSIVG